MEVSCHQFLISAGQKEVLLLSLHPSWLIQAHAATWALIPHCNVIDPQTGEEDTTMALTIRETSPMNMWFHKNCWNTGIKCSNNMLITRCVEVEHTQLQYLSYAVETTHTYIIHSTCSSWSLTENMVAELKWARSLILWRSQSATSYVAERSTQP